jgi:hypothetical protein
LQLFALEVLVGGNVVKRPYLSLNGYSLHLSIHLKAPLSLSVKRGLMVSLFRNLNATYRFTMTCKVKVEVIKSVQTCHIAYVLMFSAAKV